MDHGALDDALEAGGRLGILATVGNQVLELGIDIFDQIAPEHVEIDIAGAHDRRRILILDQRQQKMFEGGVFMAALVGGGQSTMQGLFEVTGE